MLFHPILHRSSTCNVVGVPKTGTSYIYAIESTTMRVNSGMGITMQRVWHSSSHA